MHTAQTSSLNNSEHCSIHEATRQGDIDMLDLLLTKQPELVNQMNAQGQSPLHLAARRNDPRVVRYLISKGADVNLPINLPTNTSLNNKTALQCARAHGFDNRIVKQLILAGALDEPLDGQYLIHQATLQGDTDMLDLLLTKQPKLVNQMNAPGQSPLHLAARGNDTRIVRYLISKGADINLPINQPTNAPLHNKTALLCARAHGYEKSKSIVRQLMQAGILDVPSGESGVLDSPLDGNYLIHEATLHSDIDMLELLLKQQPKLVNEMNGQEQSPLHLAVFRHDTDVIQFLISNGADINLPLNFPNTPLHKKTAWQCARARDYRDSKEILKSLIQAGSRDVLLDGTYLIHEATLNGDIDMLDLLLKKHPALVNQINDSGNSPLRLAVRIKNTYVAQYLISKGADINKASNHEKTAMHLAVNNNRTTVVNSLIKEGAADPESKNSIPFTSSILSWLGFHTQKPDHDTQATLDKLEKRNIEEVNHKQEHILPLKITNTVVSNVPATIFHTESRDKRRPYTEEDFTWRNEW